jgi:hypothetical protein
MFGQPLSRKVLLGTVTVNEIISIFDFLGEPQNHFLLKGKLGASLRVTEIF